MFSVNIMVIFCVILLTAILVFYSTFDIYLTEFLLIICAFAITIWVLTRPIARKELYQDNGTLIDNAQQVNEEQRASETPETLIQEEQITQQGTATLSEEQQVTDQEGTLGETLGGGTTGAGGGCSFSSALDALISIPGIVQQNIEPALDHLISTIKEDDEDDTVDSASIRPRAYVQSKDTYVGNLATSIEKDVMGHETKVEKFILDETMFKKMKDEYKAIDALLKLLKKGDLELYKQIIQ